MSFEKCVQDNEIVGMAMRAAEGIRVDDETLAFVKGVNIGVGNEKPQR